MKLGHWFVKLWFEGCIKKENEILYYWTETARGSKDFWIISRCVIL